ncbi:N-acetyl-gamma-glutamyl-phosphate reductase [Suttonella sp. R2A3]|uniref:N-acetyl-gamma-glutamyl-phosphate reductase n=1 Tax=Suttonella sp. R2A3 TaxID=2908648 RepID=UPI001F389688|nr:N-acetyl-gamma-glutamyl-phosphate reductase [Suttonella sp. R2A3]UJF24572.1 N-acetyl-gamma-glutamyl-phosphate reductase [Suttonella sp. R2A3]
MSNQVAVGIVGASGYSGAELLRLLLAHPDVAVKVITSRQYANQRLDSVFPNLRGVTTLSFSDPQDAPLTECDVVFFATPHGVCMREAAALIECGVRIIDFSGDFRLRDPNVFTRWYDMEHTAQDLLKEAVYGLPETHRAAIAKARLVANPGCYPTAVHLGVKPLLEADALFSDDIIADVKSGVSGAGRGAKQDNLAAEIEGNFKLYAASGHRHQPEIEQELSLLASREVHCTFVPHLVPMVRGIEATLYLSLRDPSLDVHALFTRAYVDEPFVDVLPEGAHTQTRYVRGTNFVHISVHRSVNRRTAIISVVEDNLIKGAAGQAVQSMNIMFGLAETSGLMQPAQIP